MFVSDAMELLKDHPSARLLIKTIDGELLTPSQQHYVENECVYMFAMGDDDSEASAKTLFDNWDTEASDSCWGGVLDNHFADCEVGFVDEPVDNLNGRWHDIEDKPVYDEKLDAIIFTLDE